MLKTAFAIATFIPAAALAAAPKGTPSPKIISTVEGDLNGDGRLDRAVLTDNGQSGADLIIYVGDGHHGFKPAGSARAIAFNGGLAGNSPDLQRNKIGSLQVHAENIAVGRDHWERTLTITYRAGQFVVSGITASSVDALDPNSATGCDVNLLTGKGVSEGRKISIKAGGIPLSQWTEDKAPAACR